LAGCTEQIFPKEKEEGLNDEDVRLSPDLWGADAGNRKEQAQNPDGRQAMSYI
jgi:hypothetical protein